MAVTEANLLRKIKGANIYYGCDLPTAFGEISLTAGEPAGGTDFGATIGESTFVHNANIELVDIEQASAMVAPHVTAESIGMTFKIAETTALNLREAFSQTFVQTGTTYDVMHLGGFTAVTGQCFALVAEKASDPGKYYGGMIYSAYVANETSIAHKRGEVQQVEITLAGAAVLTRSEGDQLGQYFDQR